MPNADVTSHMSITTSSAPLDVTPGKNKEQVAQLSTELEIAKIEELESQLTTSMLEVDSL